MAEEKEGMEMEEQGKEEQGKEGRGKEKGISAISRSFQFLDEEEGEGHFCNFNQFFSSFFII
jgi:hypothetical protein